MSKRKPRCPSTPEVEYEIECETGVGWSNGGAYPAFTTSLRTRYRKLALKYAKEIHAERPLYTVRVVKRLPTVIAEFEGKAFPVTLERRMAGIATGR